MGVAQKKTKRPPKPELQILKPQPGPQEQFLSSPADIIIYGGAAGGGKSFALLMECSRHLANPQFGAVIFRRTTPQIRNQGALWDQSAKIYPKIGGKPHEQDLKWTFPEGSVVKFSHMEHEKHKENHQGAEYPLICFDELTHFTYGQFVYMLSRSRSLCGVRPYIRCTTNPDSESWVAEFISWWWDPDTGYAIPERSGVIRYFIVYDETVYWSDDPEQLKDDFAERMEGRHKVMPLSFTFIAANLDDNQLLEKADPAYRAKLMAMPLLERERLLKGNWKISAGDGLIKTEWIRYYNPENMPDIQFLTWSWDTAIKEGQENDFSAGQLWACCADGHYLLARHKIKLPYPKLKLLVWDCHQLHPAKEVLIEDKASGQQLIQDFVKVPEEMKKPGLIINPMNVIKMMPNGKSMAQTKIERVNFVSTVFEAGRVFVPDPKLPGYEWVKELVLEWVKFPNAAHDDECFVAGTMIATTEGDVPIEDITTNHVVITLSGPKRVLVSKCTGVKPVISKLGLTGTSNHPIYQHGSGFKPMIDCVKASIIRNNEWDLLRMIGLQWLSLMVLNTDEWAAVETIICHNQPLTMAEKIQKGCMWLFGNIFQEKTFRRAVTSTIRMAIRLIICLTILNVYRLKNIQKFLKISTKRSESVTWKSKEPKLTSGTEVKRVESGILNTLKKLLKIASQGNTPAYTVENQVQMQELAQNKNTAPVFAGINSECRKGITTSHRTALNAVPNSKGLFPSIHPNEKKHAQDVAPVYNLKIEDDPTYFANGILVHNCDAMSQYLTRRLKNPEAFNGDIGLPISTGGGWGDVTKSHPGGAAPNLGFASGLF